MWLNIYLVNMTMVEENSVPLVKIKVLASQGVTKSLTDWLLFSQLYCFSRRVCNAGNAGAMYTDRAYRLVQKNGIEEFVNRENFLKILI